MKESYIRVSGAREKNLKNICIEIPKKKITVFTGVSGSGKTSLVFDTIAAESQRRLNETYSSFIRHRMPHYGQPDVDSIENLPVAFIVSQKQIGGNSRSTVGTVTDILSMLRLLFSRIGRPFIGYSNAFSFNNSLGMCCHCQGIGRIKTVDVEKLLDTNKSLNQGAIKFPTFEPGGWRLTRYTHSGLFDNNKKIEHYTEDEWDKLLYADCIKLESPTSEWHKSSVYEGVIPRIERSFLKKEEGETVKYCKEIKRIINEQSCAYCKGTRFNDKVLSCKVNKKNIAECTQMQVSELLRFVKAIKSSTAGGIIRELIKRLEQMVAIGLGYLSLNRETFSLSGGESQRIKMVSQLGSSLTDLTYIFDEPSIGLHPHDISKLSSLLRHIVKKGNTVLIVEHDPSIIKVADHIIDMGPGAGGKGGEVVYQGDLNGLNKSGTLTGKYLSYRSNLKETIRVPSGWLEIKNATLNNLNNVSVNIPKGVITVVTGVAGSGKSTLINHVLPKFNSEVIYIDQKGIQASKRSNLATYTGVFDIIRKLFAKIHGVKASLFSFNSHGACTTCKGLGVIYTDYAYMDTVSAVCEDCQGERFTRNVLQYKLREKNISEILAMTVLEALDFFIERKISKVLKRLSDVGIDYISLGQPLSTFSGGELQRLKLASQIETGKNIYVLDEPSTGLHTADINNLISLMNRLVDQKSTLIVIEHNLDIICQADWIIDLGPYAGHKGGNVLFSGLTENLLKCKDSITARYLTDYLRNGKEKG